jgi:hypothetical protein
VVALATLNAAIENALPALDRCDITNLEAQTTFIAQVLEAWLEASGRAEPKGATELSPQNVVYQGRILVSIIDLVPALLAYLKEHRIHFVSAKARDELIKWLRATIQRADLLRDGKFIGKDEFKEMGFLGSGGIGRFRNRLWAAAFRRTKLTSVSPEEIEDAADEARAQVNKALVGHDD